MIRSINAFDCMCVCKTSLVCLETYSSRLRVYDIRARVCVCACVPLYTTNKFHKCICTREIVASDYLTIYVKTYVIIKHGIVNVIFVSAVCHGTHHKGFDP